jgi:hypothetical protein
MRTLFIVVLLICTLTLKQSNTSAQSVSPQLSLEQLIAEAERVREAMRDFSVSYEVSLQTSGKIVGPQGHYKAVMKGRQVFVENDLLQTRPNVMDEARLVQGAFDGTYYTTYWPNRQTAVKSTRYTAQASTRESLYFDFGLLNPVEPSNPGEGSMALPTLLRLGKLRPAMEMLDGRPCHVVDLMLRDKPYMTIWLDAERGVLPIRVVLFNGSVKIHTERVERVGDFWVATSGRRTLADERDPTKLEAEWIMQVDRRPDDTPEVAINTGTNDAFFKLWDRLPTGTKVMELNADAVTETAAQLAAVLQPPAAAPAVADPYGDRLQMVVTVSVVVAAGLIMLATLVIHRRRSRR